jgi:4-amino-4-deoxy-L-arabinose transferase-like glycosyltransferase
MTFVRPLLIFLCRPAVVVFLVSALIKTIFGLTIVTDSERLISDPDSIGYYRLAENLRQHGVFSRSEQPPFIPDSVLTPVYPFFLAALMTLSGGGLWIVAVAQAIINSLTAAWVVMLGERLLDKRAGIIAGSCYAFDPSALVHTFSLLTESLFTLLFLAANFFLLSFIKKPSSKDLIESAILLGLATLCRPVGLYYFAMAVAIMLLVHSPALNVRLRNAAMYVLIFALILCPWLLRNKLTFGVASLTSLQGNNLLLMNAAYLKAAQEHIDYATAERLLEAEADSVLVAQGLPAEKLKLEYRGKQYGYQINDPRQARVYEKLALEKIIASPLLYARVHLMGLLPSLLDTSVRDFYHFLGKERPALGVRALLVTEGLKSALQKFWSRIETGYLILYLSNLGWLITHYVFAGIAIYRHIKTNSTMPVWLLLMPIIYLIFITLPAGSERFRFPAMPYLYLLSAFAVSRLQMLPPSRKSVSLS